MGGQKVLFDLQDRYAELRKSSDPLERLLSVVEFEVFRPTLIVALGRKDRSKSDTSCFTRSLAGVHRTGANNYWK